MTDYPLSGNEQSSPQPPITGGADEEKVHDQPSEQSRDRHRRLPAASGPRSRSASPATASPSSSTMPAAAAPAEALVAQIEGGGRPRRRRAGRHRRSGRRRPHVRQRPRPRSAASTCWSTMPASCSLATIAESDDALFDRQIAVNLKGTFNTLREAARRLRDGGRIVNFSSSVVGAAAADLRRLCRDQGGGRGDDQRARQGTARPQHHRQRDRARADRHQAVPRRQAAGGDRPPGQDWPRWSVSASPRTSPTPSPSSPARTAPGSTARRCAPMAGSSDPSSNC